jgi:hypothetical protein
VCDWSILEKACIMWDRASCVAERYGRPQTRTSATDNNRTLSQQDLLQEQES